MTIGDISTGKVMRDRLIFELWTVFRDMSDLQKPDDFTEEDLLIWDMASKHSAVQDKLDKMFNI